MKKLSLLIIAVCMVNIIHAQPQNRSPLSFSWLANGHTVDVKRLNLTVPVAAFKLGSSGARLLVGAGYTFVNFDFKEELYPVAASDLENFHNISLSVGYRKTINSKWSVLAFAIPQLSGNFQGDLSKSDFKVAGTISFLKVDTLRGTLLMLGAALNAQTGIPVPFPMISFRKIVSKKWEYTLGLLRSEICYNTGPESSIQSFLKIEGFTGNISAPVLANGAGEESKLTSRAVIGGLEYRYKIIRRLFLSLEAGHSLYNSLNIRNYDNDDLYDFNVDNNFYLNIGVKLAL